MTPKSSSYMQVEKKERTVCWYTTLVQEGGVPTNFILYIVCRDERCMPEWKRRTKRALHSETKMDLNWKHHRLVNSRFLYLNCTIVIIIIGCIGGNWEIDRKRKVKMNVSFEGPWNRKINLCPVEILTPPPLFLFPLWRDARLKWATTAPAFSPLDWTWKRFCVRVSVIVLCDVLCIPLAPRNYFRTAPRVFIGRKAR